MSMSNHTIQDKKMALYCLCVRKQYFKYVLKMKMKWKWKFDIIAYFIQLIYQSKFSEINNFWLQNRQVFYYNREIRFYFEIPGQSIFRIFILTLQSRIFRSFFRDWPEVWISTNKNLLKSCSTEKLEIRGLILIDIQKGTHYQKNRGAQALHALDPSHKVRQGINHGS